MAISYYWDFRPNEYFDNLERWHLDFAWWQRASKRQAGAGQAQWFWRHQGLWAILQAIYGDIIKSNETLKKKFGGKNAARQLSTSVHPGGYGATRI